MTVSLHLLSVLLGILGGSETSLLTPPATERRASGRHVRCLQVFHQKSFFFQCFLCLFAAARRRRSRRSHSSRSGLTRRCSRSHSSRSGLTRTRGRSWAHLSLSALVSSCFRDRLCLLHATLEGRVVLVSCQVREQLLLGHGHRGICIVELLARK